MPNQYLDYLIVSGFQTVNRIFILSFENEALRRSYKRYDLPAAEIKYYVMIDRKILFDQPARSGLKTDDNIRKISKRQGDDYTTGCFLDYNYFKKAFRMIAID